MFSKAILPAFGLAFTLLSPALSAPTPAEYLWLPNVRSSGLSGLHLLTDKQQELSCPSNPTWNEGGDWGGADFAGHQLEWCKSPHVGMTCGLNKTPVAANQDLAHTCLDCTCKIPPPQKPTYVSIAFRCPPPPPSPSFPPLYPSSEPSPSPC